MTTETRTTIRSVCGRARLSYRPEWNAARPWVCYVNGTAGLHFAKPDDAAPALARLGITLETPMQTMQRMASFGHGAVFRDMTSGGRWHLYRRKGADTVIIETPDIMIGSSDEWEIMVHDVHAMTAARMVYLMAAQGGA